MNKDALFGKLSRFRLDAPPGHPLRIDVELRRENLVANFDPGHVGTDSILSENVLKFSTREPGDFSLTDVQSLSGQGATDDEAPHSPGVGSHHKSSVAGCE
jgi:hypothetical protein